MSFSFYDYFIPNYLGNDEFRVNKIASELVIQLLFPYF
jgi:hypothetical protein